MAKKSPVQGKKRGTGGPVAAKSGSMKADPMDQFMKKGKTPSSLAPKSSPKSKGGPVSAAKGSMKDDPMDAFMKSGKAPKSLAPKVANSKGSQPRLASAKKGSMPDAKGIVSMGTTKSGKAKLNYQSIGGAAKPKSAKSAAPKKTKAPKAPGTGKRTRSFSESKIKRDKNGKFARK